MKRPLPLEDSFAKINDEHFNEKISLVESLMFPLKKDNFYAIEWELYYIWRNVCATMMIDDEYKYIYLDYEHAYDNQEPWEDEIEEVRRAIYNSNIWIEEAKKEMKQLCKGLFSTIACEKIYSKHYPLLNETSIRMENRSKTQDAILHHDINVDEQQRLFLKICEAFFPIILTNVDSIFIVELDRLTGYSKGKSCTKLLCKVNTTSCIVHFYPINNEELSKYTKSYVNPCIDNTLLLNIEVDEDSKFHIHNSHINNILKI